MALSSRAYAHGVIVSGMLLGIPNATCDEEVRAETDYDPGVARDEVMAGDVDEDAIRTLAGLDVRLGGLLTSTAQARIDLLLSQ